MAVNSPEHMFARAEGLRDDLPERDDRCRAGPRLGVAETRPIDLVGAYGTLANGGVRVEQTSILKVQDASGNDIKLPELADPVESSSRSRRSSSPTS